MYKSHLELIYRWYKLRKAKPSNTQVKQAYNYLNAMQPDKAEAIIKSLE